MPRFWHTIVLTLIFTNFDHLPTKRFIYNRPKITIFYKPVFQYSKRSITSPICCTHAWSILTEFGNNWIAHLWVLSNFQNYGFPNLGTRGTILGSEIHFWAQLPIRPNFFVSDQRKKIVENDQRLKVSGWFLYVPGPYMAKVREKHDFWKISKKKIEIFF